MAAAAQVSPVQCYCKQFRFSCGFHVNKYWRQQSRPKPHNNHGNPVTMATKCDANFSRNIVNAKLPQYLMQSCSCLTPSLTCKHEP